MIIIIKKDGQIVTDDGNPIEGKALEGAYMLLADAQDGDSIVYDGTNHMWKAGQGGGSFAPDITDPQDGDTLVYNATQQKWVNGAGSSGGGLVVGGTYDFETSTATMNKTWKEIYDAMCAGRQATWSVTFEVDDNVFPIVETIHEVTKNEVGFYAVSTPSFSFTTSDEDGYPSTSDEG